MNPEKAMAMLDAGLCPYCGAGPFRVVAQHIYQSHDMTAAHWKTELGLPLVYSTADSAMSAELRERAFSSGARDRALSLSRDERADMSRKAGIAARERRATAPTIKQATQIKKAQCVCEHCGKEYKNSRNDGNRFCSQQCWKQWAHERKRSYARVCPVCGKSFDFEPDRHPSRKFCSLRCSAIARESAKRLDGCTISPRPY